MKKVTLFLSADKFKFIQDNNPELEPDFLELTKSGLVKFTLTFDFGDPTEIAVTMLHIGQAYQHELSKQYINKAYETVKNLYTGTSSEASI
jgi:hypothetical protein